MTFAFPLGFLFLAGVPLIFALYLRRVRPRDQSVPSVLLWQQMVQRQARHPWMGKIRAWFSLVLQLLILALLVLALAEPLPTSPGARVLVLDTRGRMQATDALGQSAFAKARRFALSFGESARANSPIAVVATGETPRLISGFSDDPKRLREVLDQLKPEGGGGNLDEAIRFAQSMAAALTPGVEILALTDRPQASSEPATSVLTFGAPSENLGWVAAGARENNESTSIFLRAWSHHEVPQEVRLEIEQAGRLLESRPFTLNPQEPAELSFEFPRSSEAFHVRLSPPDSLTADQFVSLAVPLAPPRRILLVSTGNWFVERALRADRGIQFEMLSPEAWSPALSTAFEVTIFDQSVPPDLPDQGHFIFLNCLPGVVPETAANPAVAEFDATHPVLRAVKPDRWRIGEQRVVPSDPHRQAVVTGTAGPLLVTSESDQLRWIAVLFPLDKSDLPLRASFPVFLQDLIEWTSQSSRTPNVVTASLDPEGSDLRTAATSPIPSVQLASWTGLSAWRWLALAAFALLLIEWGTYHRRLTE